MKKRFTSEREILDEIDAKKLESNQKLAEAEGHERIAKQWAQIPHMTDDANMLREKARKLRSSSESCLKRVERLSEILAQFRTPTFGVVLQDPSVPRA